jgi:ribosomal-protein-alanine N-acetyltransferase
METVPATPAHAAVLAAVHAECFAEAWDEAAMGRLLAMPGAFAFVALERFRSDRNRSGSGLWHAQEGGRPQGFILCRLAADEGEVISVAVLRASRRAGVGRRLMGAALARAADAGAERIFLEVAENNASARAFYAAFGFSQVGRRGGYYRSEAGPSEVGRGVDALVLRLDLADQETMRPLRRPGRVLGQE